MLIQDGNTHYPSQKRTYRFFKGDLSLPPRIVLLDGSGAITLDALDWLAEQGADLIRLKWNGHIRSVSGASGYAADMQKVNWQIATRSNEAKRVAFAIPLIADKIKATVANLETYFPDSREKDNALKRAQSAISELKNKSPKTVAKLHAIEGAVAGRYFIAWNTLPIKWKLDKRHPIPDDWRTYLSRTALVADKTVRNYGATHPINAMLNYAYTVLEAAARIKAIADGYDPTIGIMHDRTRGERHSFVFDLMEPQRPIVDRTILKLIGQETFCGSDFILQSRGVCRLMPALARKIAGDCQQKHNLAKAETP